MKFVLIRWKYFYHKVHEEYEETILAFLMFKFVSFVIFVVEFLYRSGLSKHIRIKITAPRMDINMVPA